VQPVHEHRFRPQPAGSLTLRQFVESLRRWTPEMRQVAQIALTRSEAERRTYVQRFHADHHARDPGHLDGFVRWAYSDPRLEHVPLLLAEIERPEAEYTAALEHEADVLVRERARDKTPAQRVADYLALLGMENSDRVRAAVASLLPPGTPEPAVSATIRQMRRRWLELYGDDPFFAED
jgi:thioredoxin-like negative regulator of GroEL